MANVQLWPQPQIMSKNSYVTVIIRIQADLHGPHQRCIHSEMVNSMSLPQWHVAPAIQMEHKVSDFEITLTWIQKAADRSIFVIIFTLNQTLY